MTTGEWLTRATIWIAMLAWTGGILISGTKGRVCWSIGFAVYLAHIVFAYASFYEWNHLVAWRETAAQTAEVTGWETGVGLAFNFLFALVLAIDLTNQWRFGRRRWSRMIDVLVLFFLINGTVVFGNGAVRWFGCLLLGTVAVCWGKRFARGRGNSSGSSSLRP